MQARCDAFTVATGGGQECRGKFCTQGRSTRQQGKRQLWKEAEGREGGGEAKTGPAVMGAGSSFRLLLPAPLAGPVPGRVLPLPDRAALHAGVQGGHDHAADAEHVLPSAALLQDLEPQHAVRVRRHLRQAAGDGRWGGGMRALPRMGSTAW